MFEVGFKVRADDERYRIRDFPVYQGMLSETKLRPYKETKGHEHPHKEIYYFVEGIGTAKIGDIVIDVRPGKVLEIPEGTFHQVRNNWRKEMVFICLWLS